MGAKIRQLLLVSAIMAGTLGSATSAMAQSKFTGAIHTSNFRGDAVNQNHFILKEAVYLNGGPQNTKGPMVPSGTYYFQVTDNSGRTLLSTDPVVCRQVVVGETGKIESVPVIPHPDPPAENPDATCQHALGSNAYPEDPRPFDRPVQLYPFADTPSKGLGYKVWLIAQSSTIDGCVDPLPIESKDVELSFSNKCAKTDSFKVERQAGPFCAEWEDHFEGNALDTSRWEIVTGQAPGTAQQNVGSFVADHVEVSGGFLRIKLTQENAGNGFLSKGGLVRSLASCSYGWYTYEMRFGSTANDPIATGVNLSGGVSAGFTFANNSEHEIAFEHSAHTAPPHGTSAPEAAWFVSWHNSAPQDNGHDPEAAMEFAETEHPFDEAYTHVHTYMYFWEPGKVTFYIDDLETPLAVYNNDDLDPDVVPDVPGFVLLQYFGRNLEGWGGFASPGDPPEETQRFFYVNRFHYKPLLPEP